jgi:hypothetical protein
VFSKNTAAAPVRLRSSPNFKLVSSEGLRLPTSRYRYTTWHELNHVTLATRT